MILGIIAGLSFNPTPCILYPNYHSFLNLSTTHSFQQHNEAASTGSRKGQELSKADNLKRYLSADNDSPKSKRQKRSGTRFPRKGADVLPQI